LLFFVRKVLLDHTANLAVSIEVFADHPFLIKRTTDFLGGAAKCTIRCEAKTLAKALEGGGGIGHTIEH